ncbi:MAG: hypothetical protein HYV54_00765 [Parcubacteria group bacterium]|nr:hypothetical protein [Parcubacteria group bacterium]
MAKKIEVDITVEEIYGQPDKWYRFIVRDGRGNSRYCQMQNEVEKAKSELLRKAEEDQKSIDDHERAKAEESARLREFHYGKR